MKLLALIIAFLSCLLFVPWAVYGTVKLGLSPGESIASSWIILVVGMTAGIFYIKESE